MRIGWLGLGKVGSCCALALAAAGNAVTGYDPHPDAWARLAELDSEEGADELLASGATVGQAAFPGEVVAASDIVFVCVPTPHAPGYGGETVAPDERADFEYAYLVQACADVCDAAMAQAKQVTLVVVSTVLPGTISTQIRPLLHGNTYVRLVYSPVLISLGTTIRDFTSPPVVICGADQRTDLALLKRAYGSLHGASYAFCDFATAELAKVAWNACLTVRISYATYLAEVAHGIGADVDMVTELLAHAYSRPVTAGMVDGGPCRPRDLIALSWLSQRLGVSFDIPGMLVRGREAQARGLAALAMRYADPAGERVLILGTSYKARSLIHSGSPALLLANILGENAAIAGKPSEVKLHRPRVFVLAVRDDEFASLDFPAGSVVIDPWGIVPSRAGVTVVAPGRR